MSQLLKVLETPPAYDRDDLHDAVEYLWPLLFPEYKIISPRDLEKLGYWTPHILAQKFDPETLIVAKVRRDLARTDAIRQLKQQVAIFHESLPELPVYPIVFGPWEQESLLEIIEPDDPGDYQVGILRVQDLLLPIQTVASHVLRKNKADWQRILGFDWTRLPIDALQSTEIEMLFWLLDCPVALVSEKLRAYLAVDLSDWEPQLGRTQGAEDQEEGSGSDEDHSSGEP